MIIQYESSKKVSRQEHLLGLAILVAFLLPHTNTLFLMINPLLCMLLVMCSQHKSKISYSFVAIIPIVVSLLLNMHVASLKAFQSTFIILLYFACFPFVGRIHVRNVYLHICLSYIIISQIVYLLGIPFLTNFFDTAYPISDDDYRYYSHIQNTISYGNIFSYRLGGLYHNPNQCARAVTFLLAFFLALNSGKNSRGSVTFLLIIYTSILLTGSRTGFVVSTLLLYFGYLRNERQSKEIRMLFVFLALLGLVYIISTGTALRGFDIESGLNNSVDSKWYTFLYYLFGESSLVSLLFGHLDPMLFTGSYGVAMHNFDSEYGELFFRFGFIGTLGVICFWWMTFKYLDKKYRFFYILFLWMVSSTVVSSFRAFFMCMLLLSVLVANSSKHARTVKYI